MHIDHEQLFAETQEMLDIGILDIPEDAIAK